MRTFVRCMNVGGQFGTCYPVFWEGPFFFSFRIVWLCCRMGRCQFKLGRERDEQKRLASSGAQDRRHDTQLMSYGWYNEGGCAGCHRHLIEEIGMEIAAPSWILILCEFHPSIRLIG